MSNGVVTPDYIAAKELRAEVLNLNGMRSKGIAHDPKQDTDLYDLITKGFLDSALLSINQMLKELDPNGTRLQDLSLISLSLTDPFFSDTEDWVAQNWVIQENEAYCIGGKANNSLTLSQEVFPKNGQYLIAIIVNEVPSGYLEIRKNGEWVQTIREPGAYYVELTIDNILTDEVSFVGVDVGSQEDIRVFSISVHFVAERFYNYLINKIRSLATVDTEGFVPRDEYLHTLDEFIVQFNEVTERFLKTLTQHVTQHNAHGVTADSIGAAEKGHKHTEYVTEKELEQRVEDKLGDYALAGHVHDEYLTRAAASAIIGELLREHVAGILSVDPLIVTRGPSGLLPSRFAQTDVSRPVTILIPTTIDHNGVYSFDDTYGLIATNIEALMNEAPKVFSLNMEDMAQIPQGLDPKKENINFRISYHSKRQVEGYRLITRGNKPQQWSVYAGNTEFIHAVTAPVFTDEGDTQVAEVFFEEPQLVEQLSFILNSLEDALLPAWECKIEVLYADFEMTEFGVTRDEFEFCIPTNGSNRVVTVPASADYRYIRPEVCSHSLPLYIYAGNEVGESSVNFDHSYYPAEYGNERRGFNIFLDDWINAVKDEEMTTESYIHPVFGKLTLTEGLSADGSDLRNIYSSSVTGWLSDGNYTRITIEQTIKSDDVCMMGYMLNWRHGDQANIPEKWTLTVEGKDEKERDVVMVLDSVQQYYPFYSVEDDDIVYHKKFIGNIAVKKITLTMETTKDTPIGLNKLFFYLSERFYSIPQNTMFLGLHPISQMCIGSATYTDRAGWRPVNPCFGKNVVIPINHLSVADGMTDYEVPNLFHSTDVIVTIMNYQLQAMLGESPSAYVSEITQEKIGVFVDNPFRYAVSISRTW